MNGYALTSLIPESALTPLAYVGLILVALLALYGLVSLIRRNSSGKREEKSPDTAPAGNPDDAAVAAAIAASIVVTEDEMLTAAITAAVAVYLDLENGGSSLPTGFRVVSYKKRGSGAWNRVSK